MAGGVSFAAVSAGYAHTCGLTVGGAAYCWGNNYQGQLGDGSGRLSNSPRYVWCSDRGIAASARRQRARTRAPVFRPRIQSTGTRVSP